ncbi:MAG: hypothetical protein IPM92_05895 [Saprospiraceae bacterium]|nr:hypothetical protein [Saprospiraceae bacterium]
MKHFKFAQNCFLQGFILVFFAFQIHAQSFTKGKLTMEVEKILLNGEEAPAQMGASLGNIKLEIFADGTRQKTVFNMMMMKTETYYDSQSDSLKMFMDLMGKKYLVADSKKSMHAISSQQTSSDPFEIKEYREDVKDILGYPCYRVDVKMKMPTGEAKSLEASGDLDLKLYVTDQLKFDASYITNGKQHIDLKGTPLEYNMRMGSGGFAMEMIMLAKEFSKEVQVTDFDYPKGNYKLYSMETFQQEMSQMKR